MNQHLYWCHLKETPNTSKLCNCPILRLNHGSNWSGSLTISGLNIASGGAQYLTLLKYFSHPSFSYFFSTPPINLKLGLQIGGRLLVATYVD